MSHGHSAVVTERLVLRPMVVADAAMLRELWTERDPRVPPHRRIDAEGRPTVEDLENRLRGSRPPDPLGLCAIVRADTGEVIGYCGLNENTDRPADEPELAFELLRRAWGQGFATEAARAVVERAPHGGCRRLWAGVRDWNVASRRVLVKLGFVETDRVERDAVHGDSIVTVKEW